MAHRRSTDVLTGDDTRKFLHEAMTEEGIEPDFVEIQSYEKDPFAGNTSLMFIAGKEINGEMQKARAGLDISPEEAQPDRVHQQVAMVARNLAEHFRDLMIDVIEIGGTRLRFCSAEGGWVECDRCGQRVTLSDRTMNVATFSAEAEFTNPSPTLYDIQKFLQRLDSGEQEVLKLYLLGALRKQCRCDFGLPRGHHVHNTERLK